MEGDLDDLFHAFPPCRGPLVQDDQMGEMAIKLKTPTLNRVPQAEELSDWPSIGERIFNFKEILK